MKRKTTKEILAESFRELAENKSIDKISVREIVDNCGYSTATFYRQFQDKYDLIAWDYTQDIREIVQHFDGTKNGWRQALSAAADYYDAHKEYLANLLLHTSGYHSFVTYMTEINYASLRNQILLTSGSDLPDEKTAIYLHAYCMGTVALTCECILGRYSVSLDDLKEIYERLVPEPLYPYLY